MERLTRLSPWYRGFIWGFVLAWVGINAYHIQSAQAATPPKQIEPEFNITTTTVLVHWFDTEVELQAALQDTSVAGASECEWRPDFNTSFCEFWIVQPVDIEDGYNFDTIGHEFYHALTGDFHAEY